MKKTIMVSAFFTAFNLNAESIESKYILKINDNNIFKVIEPVLTENQSTWMQVSIDCDEWLPLSETIPQGNNFTQNRNCTITEESIKTQYKDSAIISQETLSRTTESTESQTSIGTQQETNLIDSLPTSSFSHSSAYTYGPVLTSNLAFDNDNNTRWETNARVITNQFINIDMLKNVKVTKFDYNNSTPWPGRSPKDFSIQASDNGSSWITYYTGVMPNNTYQTITFDVSGVSNAGHRYWRVFFNNNYGDIYAIVASEINLYGHVVN